MCYPNRHNIFLSQYLQKLLPFYALFFGLPFVFSQHPHPAWRNYSTDHGLPSSEVHCIQQDREGYMWFGTDNGLARFDGYTFKSYSSPQGLKNNMVVQLQEDQMGRIWINTLSQNLYYFERDSIYPYAHNNVIQSLIQEHKDYRMLGGYFHRQDDGTLYLELPFLGILKIWPNGRFHLFESQTPNGQMVFDLGEKILCTYTGLPVIKQHALRNQGIYPAFELYLDSIPIIVQGFQHTVYSSNNHVKKIAEGQYLVWRQGSHYLIEDGRIVWQKDFKKGYSSTPKSLVIDQHGAIIEGAYTSGNLRKYDNLEAFKQRVFTPLLDIPLITSVSIDDDGGMWVGTTEAGLFYHPNNNFEIFDQSSGLPAANINSLALINNDSVVVGSNLRGISLIDRKTPSIEVLPNMYPGWDGAIADLAYDPKRAMLIASARYIGIFQNGKWRQIPVLRTSGLRQLLASKNIRLNADYSTLYGSGNFILKKELHELDRPEAVAFFTFPESSFTTFEDREKRVWIGGMSGLYELKQDTFLRPETMHPGFTIRVEDINQLSDSTMVIGTKGAGLLLWKGADIFSITQSDGLSANMIENLHVDDWDNIWVGTLKGLNKVVIRGPDSIFIKQFNMHHGMPSNEITSVKTQGTHIWVATTRGVVHFEDNRAINTKTSPPKLAKILFNNKPFHLNSTPQLPSSENNLVVHYLSIAYHQNGNILYRYRLNPTQQAWSYTTLRSVNFAALKAGNYTFEVQSQNEDGFWSTSTQYQFKIRPPFWQSWWFISLLAITAISVAYAFYRYRINQLRQETQIAQQIVELERSSLQAQMNPHFIFNCLSAISSFFNEGDKVSGNYYLSTFARLIRAVLHHSRSNQISLEEELTLLDNYIQMEQMRFESGFDYEVQLGAGVEPFSLKIPPMLLQPYIENAIIHGLAKKEGKGKVELQCDLEPAHLKVTITDNGMGIKASQKLKTTIGAMHKSVGMTITQKRLALLSANGQNGKVETKEVEDLEGRVIGTSVVVWIPVSNAAPS